METGEKFEALRGLYAKRGLILNAEGELSTPGGYVTGKHIAATWAGVQPIELSYKSKNPHDLPQAYAIKSGWTSNYQ